MRRLQIAAGLLLIPLFAVAVLAALGMTYTLVKDGVGSGGNAADFEARLRHYSDWLEVRPDGSWVLHQTAHPVASFLVFFVGSWGATILLGYVLERLRRRVHP